MVDNRVMCTRCVCDSSMPGIKFDDKGICNFCKIHDLLEDKYPLGDLGQQRLDQLLKKIKSKGEDNKYDCVVGVSGGTDSTYCLYMAKKLGLRPLAVHFDNHWNSDIAIKNMKNAVKHLEVDLKTITCDWNEFKDLQISFLKASVPDAEMPTDIGIISSLYRAAKEEGIKYILNGHSFRAEGVMPLMWSYGDGRYLKSVINQFGGARLDGFPNLTISNLLYYSFIKGIRVVPFLSFIDYSKEESKRLLEQELDWTYYGGHHFESTYTYFISYIRYKKFNINSRLVEYSALVRSGEVTRNEALEIVKEHFPVQKDVIDYCVARLGLDNAEFEEIMTSEIKSFLDYPTYYPIIKMCKYPIKLSCDMKILPEIFYEKYLR